MACRICETRRPRRFCPGVGGDICSICCGTERENTVSCPLECEYLQEARAHEKPVELTPEQVPYREIRVSEGFLNDNAVLFMFLSRAIVNAGLSIPGAVDQDVRDALDAMIRTYRTLESGLYYETKPANLLAAAIQAKLQQEIEEFRRQSAQESGMTTVRDADILGVLVFLLRTSARVDNGRRRGRTFLDILRSGPREEDEAASPLVLPGDAQP
jgi:hypothetical protein